MTERVMGERGAGEHLTEVIDFAQYRRLYEAASPAFRQLGILDETKYAGALQDEQTIFAHIQGNRIPLASALRHADGFDVDHCRRLTGTNNVHLLTLPAELLSECEIESTSLPEDSSIIVESDHCSTEALQATIAQVLAGLNSFTVRDFLNPEVVESNRRAALSLYSFYMGAVEQDGILLPHRNLSFSQLAQEEALEGRNDPEIALFSGQDLRDNSAISNQLWELYKDRFGWLSQYHPLTMEDTPENFSALVHSPNTYTVGRFQGEKLVCAGFFMTNLAECPWLRGETIDQALRAQEEAGDQPLYFAGIASNVSSAHHARPIMQYISRLIQREGGGWQILFESTNVSSLYIPQRTRHYIREAEATGGATLLSPIEKMGQIDYWFITPSGKDHTGTNTP